MKKLALAIAVAVGIVVSGFLFVTNQSISDSTQPVISNTNRDAPLTEVVPVPVMGVNQAKVPANNPLRYHYTMMIDDFGLSMYLLQQRSLYDDKTELEDMPGLYMIAYKDIKETLEKLGNVLPSEEEFEKNLRAAVKQAAKDFKAHPEQFRDESAAHMKAMATVLNDTVMNSVSVFAERDAQGSIEDALSRGFADLTESIGDHYAEFLPPAQAQSLDDQLNETLHFSGIGARLSPTEDGTGVEINYTYTGSPAHLAGLLPGDVIMKVRGEPVVAKNFEQVGDVTDKIKGDAGTTVVLDVKRGSEMLEFKIERAPIQGTTAIAYRHGDYAHVVLSSFGKDSDQDIQRALDMLAQPGKPLKGIILDLRENGGGILGGAVRIYDMFEKAGVKVVTTTSRHVKDGSEVSDVSNNTDAVLETEDNSGLLNIPLVILINGHSASASEILSGSMKANERAFVIGSKSFGKGIAQGVIPLYGDPVSHPTVKFTSEEFFVGTNKVRIHHIGVTPNQEVDQGLPAELVDPQTTELKIKRMSMMDRLIYYSDPSKDPVLRAGLEYLDLYQRQ